MNHFDLNQKLQSEHDLKKIIFDVFEMCVFQQTVGISMNTVLLFSSTCSFVRMRQIHNRDSHGKRKEADPTLQFHIFLYRHVLSINNYKLGDDADLIYATELEVNDATDTGFNALYLEIHLEINSDYQLRTLISSIQDCC